MSANVTLRIRKEGKKQLQEVTDLEKLEYVTTKDKYQMELENKFEMLLVLEEETTPDGFWMTMKNTFMDTACSVLGRREKKER